MQKPYRFSILDTKTGEWSYQNYAPMLHHLQTYEPTDNPNVKELKQTKEVYEYMRYEAALRLYNYLTYTKKGLPIPKIKPNLPLP